MIDHDLGKLRVSLEEREYKFQRLNAFVFELAEFLKTLDENACSLSVRIRDYICVGFQGSEFYCREDKSARDGYPVEFSNFTVRFTVLLTGDGAYFWVEEK